MNVMSPEPSRAMEIFFEIHSGLRREGPGGDMAAVPAKAGLFNLLWSEGAAYIVGIEKALRAWRLLLEPRGWLAFTEAVWLKPDPPEPVLKNWEEYPEIATVGENLERIARGGFKTAGHFTLPESAWWADYYGPLEKRLAALREKYRDDGEALGIIALNQNEIDVFRAYPGYYGYEFFVCRLGDRSATENPFRQAESTDLT